MGNINIALLSKNIQQYKEQNLDVKILQDTLNNEKLSDHEIQTVFDDFKYKADLITEFKVRLYHLKNQSNEFMVSAIEAKMNSVDNFEHIIDSISRLEEGLDPDNPDNIRSVYLKKIQQFKNKNYDVSELEKFKKSNIVKFVTLVDEFARGIKIIDDLRKRIDSLTYPALMDEVKILMKDMTDPLKARDCLKKVIYFENLVKDSKSFFEKRIAEIKEKGYETSDIEKILSQDFDDAYRQFAEFEKRINKFEKIKDTIPSINCPDTEEKVKQLKTLVLDIKNIDKIKEIYDEIHKIIFKKKSDLLKQCNIWDEQGFDISVFEDIHPLDYKFFKETFDSFKNNITELVKLSENFKDIENKWFPEECKTIRALLLKPLQLNDLKDHLKKLENMMEESCRLYSGEALKWKAQGFLIKELEEIDTKNLKEKLDIYHLIEADLDLIPELRRKIDDLDKSIYADKIKEIEEGVKNPAFVHQAFRIIETLEESSVDKRKAIKEQLKNYAEQNYKIESIQPYLESRLDLLLEKWDLFKNNADKLKKIEKQLNSYGATPFDPDLEEIKFNLKDPARAEQAEKSFKKFHNKCEDLKNFYKEKILDYKKLGYTTEGMLKVLDEDFVNIEKRFYEFEIRVSLSIDLVSELEKIDTTLFKEEAEQIKSCLKDINEIDAAKKKFENFKLIVESNKENLKNKIENFSKRGYNVSALLNIIDKSQEEIINNIEEFEKCINHVCRLKTEFEEIDRDYFSSESLEIEALLLRPLEHEKVKALINELQKKVTAHRDKIHNRIKNLENEGYDTSGIRPFLHSRLTVLSNQAEIFFEEISSLKKIESSLFSIDSSIFPKHKKEILRLLKIPGNQDKAQKEIEILKNRINIARKYYKDQIDYYRNSGYRVDSLEKSLSKSLISVKETFETFETRLPELIRQKLLFFTLSRGNYPELEKEITNLLSDPMSLNMLKDSMENLKARLENENSVFLEYIEKMKSQGYTTDFLEVLIDQKEDIKKAGIARYKELLARLEELKLEIFDLDSTFDYTRFASFMEKTMDVQSIVWLEKNIMQYISDLEQSKAQYKEKIAEYWDYGLDISIFTLNSNMTFKQLKEMFDDFKTRADQLIEKTEYFYSLDLSLLPDLKSQAKKLSSDIDNYQAFCALIRQAEKEIKKENESIRYKINAYKDQGWNIDFFKNIEKLNIISKQKIVNVFEKNMKKSISLARKIVKMDFSLFPNQRKHLLDSLKKPENANILTKEIEEIEKLITLKEKELNQKIECIKDYDLTKFKNSIKGLDLKNKLGLFEKLNKYLEMSKDLEKRITENDSASFIKESALILKSLSDPFNYDKALKAYEELIENFKKQKKEVITKLTDYKKEGWIFRSHDLTDEKTIEFLCDKACKIEEKIDYSLTLNKKIDSIDFSLYEKLKFSLKKRLKKLDNIHEIENQIKEIEIKNKKHLENLNQEIKSIQQRFSDVISFKNRISELNLKEKLCLLDEFKIKINLTQEHLKKFYSLDLSIFEDTVERVKILSENPENADLIESELKNTAKKISEKNKHYLNTMKRWEKEQFDISSLKLSVNSPLKLKSDLVFDFEMLIPKTKIQIQRLNSVDTSVYEEEAKAVKEALQNPFRLIECQLRIDALETAEQKFNEWILNKITSYKSIGLNVTFIEDTKGLSLFKIIDRIDKYEKALLNCKTLKETLLNDDLNYFEKELAEIENLFLNPLKFELIENKIKDLLNKYNKKRDFIKKKLKDYLENESMDNDFSVDFADLNLFELDSLLKEIDEKRVLIKNIQAEFDKKDFSLFEEQALNIKNFFKDPLKIDFIKESIDQLNEEYKNKKEKFLTEIEEFEINGYFVSDLKKMFKTQRQKDFLEKFDEYKKQVNEIIDLRKEISDKYRYGIFKNEVQRLESLTYNPSNLKYIRNELSEFTKTREKYKNNYIRKKDTFERLNYDISELDKSLETGDFDYIDKIFSIFETNIKEIDKIKSMLQPLKCIYFSSEFRKIENLLNNPFKLDEIDQLFKSLQNKIKNTRAKLIDKVNEYIRSGYSFDWIDNIGSMTIDELNSRIEKAESDIQNRMSQIDIFKTIKSELPFNFVKNIENIIELKKIDSTLDKAVKDALDYIDKQKKAAIDKILSLRSQGYAFDFIDSENSGLKTDDLKKVYSELCSTRDNMKNLEAEIDRVDFSIQPHVKDEFILSLLDLRNPEIPFKILNQAREYEEKIDNEIKTRIRDMKNQGYEIENIEFRQELSLSEKVNLIDRACNNIDLFKNLKERLNKIKCEKFSKEIDLILELMKNPFYLDKINEMTLNLESRVDNEIKKIKSKIKDYQFQGYNIKTILIYENKPYPELQKYYDEFKIKIEWLNNLKERIEHINEGVYSEKLNELKSHLHDIEKIEEIEKGITEYIEALEEKRTECRIKISVFEKKGYNTQNLKNIISKRVGDFEASFNEYIKLVKKADLLMDRLNKMDLEMYEHKKNEARELISSVYDFENASRKLYELEYFLENETAKMCSEIEESVRLGYVKPDYVKIVFDKSTKIKQKKECFERFKSQINILRALLSNLEKMDTSLFSEFVNEIYPLFMDCTKIEYLDNKLDLLRKSIEDKWKALNLRIEDYKKRNIKSCFFTNTFNYKQSEVQEAFDFYDSLKDIIENKKERLKVYTQYEEERKGAQELIDSLDRIEGINDTISKIDEFEKTAKGYYAMAIKRYKEKGYSTARLEAALPETPDILQNIFKSYESDLAVLENALSYMETLDPGLYLAEEKEIQKISKNPSGAARAARIIERVRQKEDQRRQDMIETIEKYREQGFDVSELDKKRGESNKILAKILTDFNVKAQALREYRIDYDLIEKLCTFMIGMKIKNYDLNIFSYIQKQLNDINSYYYSISRYEDVERGIIKIKADAAQKIGETLFYLSKEGYNTDIFDDHENLNFALLTEEFINFMKDIKLLEKLKSRIEIFDSYSSDPDYITALSEIKNTVALEFIEEKIELLAGRYSKTGLKTPEMNINNFTDIQGDSKEKNVNEQIMPQDIEQDQVKEKDTTKKENINSEDTIETAVSKAVERETEKSAPPKSAGTEDTKAPSMTDDMKKRFEEWKKREQKKK